MPDEDRQSVRALAGLRAPWFEVSCCPPNVARTLANLGLYFASASEDTLHLHQYADLTVDTTLGSGAPVKLQVRTGYPDAATVSVVLLGALDARSSVALRIPSWARGRAVLSTGAVIGPDDQTVIVAGPLPAGHEVVLHLPMLPRVTRPHPRVDAIRGQVALERGPFVLAVEDIDLPEGVTVNDIAIDPDRSGPAGEVSGWLSW